MIDFREWIESRFNTVDYFVFGGELLRGSFFFHKFVVLRFLALVERAGDTIRTSAVETPGQLKSCGTFLLGVGPESIKWPSF